MIKVTLKYDPIWRPLDWAKAHCKSYITNDTTGRGHNDTWENLRVNYYFGNEQDAMLFTLRWSDQVV
jgi:hypothetical protein